MWVDCGGCEGNYFVGLKCEFICGCVDEGDDVGGRRFVRGVRERI